MLPNIKQDWFSNVRGDVLAGIVVALALIPEAIAFSIIAEVDPKVGLYASFCIAVVTAFTGGRPGMISAATSGYSAKSFCMCFCWCAKPKIRPYACCAAARRSTTWA